MTIKKITTLLMLSVLPLGVLTAQQEKDYLPKAGDWALGIDMQPVYQFFGNLANDNAFNTLRQFGGEDVLGVTNNVNANNVSLIGKYMLDRTTAIRVNIGIDKDVTKHYEYRQDDKALFENPLSEAKVEDYYKHNDAFYSIAVGIEFRKGKNRIQGYYGADLIFGKHKERYQMTYGNAVTDINQTPTRGEWVPATATVPAHWYYPYNDLGLGVHNVPYWTESFLTESYAKAFVLGLAGKVGVECFVFPGISLGGEVSLTAMKEYNRGSYTKSEGFNPTTEQVEIHTELMNPRNSEFFLRTNNLGGKLFMMFYF